MRSRKPRCAQHQPRTSFSEWVEAFWREAIPPDTQQALNRRDAALLLNDEAKCARLRDILKGLG